MQVTERWGGSEPQDLRNDNSRRQPDEDDEEAGPADSAEHLTGKFPIRTILIRLIVPRLASLPHLA
jgi:hypothetical protein